MGSDKYYKFKHRIDFYLEENGITDLSDYRLGKPAATRSETSSSGAATSELPIVLYNSVINIMSGESLFRYLFDDYDSIISKISDEINSHFPSLNTPPEAPSSLVVTPDTVIS